MDNTGYQTLYVDGYNPEAIYYGYGYDGWGTSGAWNTPVCGFDGRQYQNYCEFKCNSLTTHNFYLGNCVEESSSCDNVVCSEEAFSYMESRYHDEIVCFDDGNDYRLDEVCKAHCKGAKYDHYYSCSLNYEEYEAGKANNQNDPVVCAGSGSTTISKWMWQRGGYIYHSGSCTDEELISLESACYFGPTTTSAVTTTAAQLETTEEPSTEPVSEPVFELSHEVLSADFIDSKGNPAAYFNSGDATAFGGYPPEKAVDGLGMPHVNQEDMAVAAKGTGVLCVKTQDIYKVKKVKIWPRTTGTQHQRYRNLKVTVDGNDCTTEENLSSNGIESIISQKRAILFTCDHDNYSNRYGSDYNYNEIYISNGGDLLQVAEVQVFVSELAEPITTTPNYFPSSSQPEETETPEVTTSEVTTQESTTDTTGATIVTTMEETLPGYDDTTEEYDESIQIYELDHNKLSAEFQKPDGSVAGFFDFEASKEWGGYPPEKAVDGLGMPHVNQEDMAVARDEEDVLCIKTDKFYDVRKVHIWPRTTGNVYTRRYEELQVSVDGNLCQNQTDLTFYNYNSIGSPGLNVRYEGKPILFTCEGGAGEGYSYSRYSRSHNEIYISNGDYFLQVAEAQIFVSDPPETTTITTTTTSEITSQEITTTAPSVTATTTTTTITSSIATTSLDTTIPETTTTQELTTVSDTISSEPQKLDSSKLSAAFSDGKFYNAGQSASFGGFPPEKALDGLQMPHTVWAEQAIAASKTASFIVTADNHYNIVEVRIWPRADKVLNRYSQLAVEVDGSSCISDDDTGTSGLREKIELGAAFVFSCDVSDNRNSRNSGNTVVTISNENSQILQIAEVELFHVLAQNEVSTETPSTEAPSTEAPSTEAPSTEPTSTEISTSETSSTAPATEAPSSQAPSTQPPSTTTSSTEAPSTESITTAQEVTEPTTSSDYSCEFIPNSRLSAEFSDGKFFSRGQSAAFGGFPPNNAVDGKGMPHTVWEEQAISDGNTQSLIVNLDSSESIQEVIVWPRGDKTAIMGRFTELSVSVNGKACSTNYCLSASCIKTYHSESRGVLYNCGGEIANSINISNENNQLLMIAEVQIKTCSGTQPETVPTEAPICDYIPFSQMSASFSDGTWYQTGQSARFGGFPPEKAVDGKQMPHTVWEEQALSASKTASLNIQLGGSYQVAKVDVWPRGDKTGSVLRRYEELAVSGSGITCSTNACLTSFCIAQSNSRAEPISFDCSGDDVSEITVSNENDQYLQIAEVQVYQCSASDSEAETDSPTTIRCNIIVPCLNFFIYFLQSKARDKMMCY